MSVKRVPFILFILMLVIVVAGVRHPNALAAPTAPAPGQDDLQQVNAPLSPPLTDFAHIWTGDGVDNLNPAVAYNSRHDEYLVVWENDRGATRDIYARRVSAAGDVLSWFTIVSNANKWNWLPDVAYNPVLDEYLVVYTYQVTTSDYDIWARRVKWDGSWMSAEIAVNQDGAKQWYPAVAYNSHDDEYLVVYENDWGGLRDIAAQRVDGDGALLSWRSIATGAGTERRLPDVAYNPVQNGYLIAYTYQHPTNGDIRAKMASANLGTLGAEFDIVPNTFHQDGVALAAGPNEYLAVWEDGPNTTERTVYGRRISTTGQLHPYIPIAVHTGQACIEQDVAFSHAYGYVVTWRYIPATGQWDVFGRLVEPGQNSATGPEFPIDDDPHSQRSPALACSISGACLIVEEDNSSQFGPVDYEIRGRIVQSFRLLLPIVTK